MTFETNPRRRIVAIAISFLVFGPPSASASNFLAIGDRTTEHSIVPLLEARGHIVDVSPGTDATFDGTTDLLPYDAVILLDGEGYEDGMPLSGQDALKAYVDGGGGLLLLEWVAYEYLRGRYSQMGDLIPLRRTSGATSDDVYTILVTHEITEGLPPSFIVPRQGFNVGTAVSGTVLVTADSAGDSVVVDEYGAGRIVQFSTAGNYGGNRPFDQDAASDNFNRLFAQAAEWVASASFADVIVVEIDIEPNNASNHAANHINLSGSGLIPVAILGSEELDVADVDPTSLAFGPDAATPDRRLRVHFKDVNRDDFQDLIVRYRTDETGITSESIEACITGETFGAIPFEGCDDILVRTTGWPGRP